MGEILSAPGIRLVDSTTTAPQNRDTGAVQKVHAMNSHQWNETGYYITGYDMFFSGTPRWSPRPENISMNRFPHNLWFSYYRWKLGNIDKSEVKYIGFSEKHWSLWGTVSNSHNPVPSQVTWQGSGLCEFRYGVEPSHQIRDENIKHCHCYYRILILWHPHGFSQNTWRSNSEFLPLYIPKCLSSACR